MCVCVCVCVADDDVRSVPFVYLPAFFSKGLSRGFIAVARETLGTHGSPLARGFLLVVWKPVARQWLVQLILTDFDTALLDFSFSNFSFLRVTGEGIFFFFFRRFVLILSKIRCWSIQVY